MKYKKIALVHYWLVNWRGGELVLRDAARALKDYDVYIYTHVIDEKLKSHFPKNVKFKTTFINHLPFAKKFYQLYILLMPLALKALNLDDYELIITFESGPAKGIKTKYNNRHISYVHSPMRYIWDMHDEYIQSSSLLEKIYLKIITPILRAWDIKTSKYPKKIICNSNFVKKRIKKYWNRNAEVVYPGIDIVNTQKYHSENFYLFIGELNHYKKADLVFDAFKQSGRRLKIIGKGPFYNQFSNSYTDNIDILGRVSDEKKWQLIKSCKALIFPSKEDFGLVPIEAMIFGKPVIAFNSGGAKETVINGKTGYLFNEQNVSSLNEKINVFEKNYLDFDSNEIIKHGHSFSSKEFQKNFFSIITKQLL